MANSRQFLALWRKVWLNKAICGQQMEKNMVNSSRLNRKRAKVPHPGKRVDHQNSIAIKR